MSMASQTVDEILQALGYPDPMMAAREQGRMILYGRLARYRAELQRLAHKWGTTLPELAQKYEEQGQEDFAADDDYLDWRWYTDAVRAVERQLSALEVR